MFFLTSNYITCKSVKGFSDASVVQNLSANAGLIPGLGRSPGEGNGNPFQYSCLENCMDRGAWQAIVHGVAKGWRRLSDQRTITTIKERERKGEKKMVMKC